MRIFKRKEEKVQIELSDGTIKELTIKEQLRDVIDKVFEMEIALAGQVNSKMQFLLNGVETAKSNEENESNIVKMIEETPQELLNEALKTNNELFKIITSEENVEWIKDCHDSVLKEVYDIFMTVNPYYSEKKRLLESILKELNM